MCKLKRSIALILALAIIITSAFVACSKNNDVNEADQSTADPNGLEANADEYVLDSVPVTDKDGKEVTDANGNVVTTDVAYKVVTKKNGESYGVKIDSDGNEVTNSKGKEVTIKITTTKPTTRKDSIPVVPTTKNTTVGTKPATGTTEAKLTTIESSKDKVPSLSASGKQVKFSQQDADTVADMLMVPYLYNDSYENANGVPTNIAAHAAMWMAAREGLNTSTFASGTIVLDLFKFFGQTVVNFKSKVNSEPSKDYAIKYTTSNDTFSINSFEKQTHTVTNLAFYSLGNNNYYKVEGTVKGCKYKKVTAIIQRNKLESTLGFSIKALKWS